MNKETTDKVKLAVIQKDLEYIKCSVEEIKGKLDKEYVTQDEFTPVKNIVYGIVGLILTSVVGALITLILKQ
jgi:hypothetical protein